MEKDERKVNFYLKEMAKDHNPGFHFIDIDKDLQEKITKAAEESWHELSPFLSWFEPPEFTWQADEVRNAPAHHWTISSGSKIE